MQILASQTQSKFAHLLSFIAVLASLLTPCFAAAYGSNDLSSQLNFYRSDVRGNSAPLKIFRTQRAAQSHCPRDMVVWLQKDTGIWAEPGEQKFGRSPHGTYVCRKEAALAHKRHTHVTP